MHIGWKLSHGQELGLRIICLSEQPAAVNVLCLSEGHLKSEFVVEFRQKLSGGIKVRSTRNFLTASFTPYLIFGLSRPLAGRGAKL